MIDMVTKLKLKPGQKGTKALVKEYGDALICVRYRYDAATRTRLKTVELIVERKVLPEPRRAKADEAPVPVRIAYREAALRKMARALGGEWDPEVRLWYIPHPNIKGTELEKHIVLDADPKPGHK